MFLLLFFCNAAYIKHRVYCIKSLFTYHRKDLFQFSTMKFLIEDIFLNHSMKLMMILLLGIIWTILLQMNLMIWYQKPILPWSNLRKRKKRPLKLIIQKRFPILNSNQSPKIIMSVSSIAALEISTHFQTSKGVSLQHELLICNQFLRNKNDFSHLSNTYLKDITIRQCNRFFCHFMDWSKVYSPSSIR